MATIRLRLLICVCLAAIVTANSSFAEDNFRALKNELLEGDMDSAYRIGSGDILEIMTWKEADFTRPQVLVRIDGKISFPLIGDMQAADLTPLQLKKNIEAGLKDYVSDPVVTVTVIQPESQKFYILGEVANTGEFSLRKGLTILQAFSLAGGFTEWAQKDEIILLRQKDSKEKAIQIYKEGDHQKENVVWMKYNDKDAGVDIIRINYRNIIKGKELNKNLKIRANDTIIVP